MYSIKGVHQSRNGYQVHINCTDELSSRFKLQNIYKCWYSREIRTIYLLNWVINLTRRSLFVTWSYFWVRCPEEYLTALPLFSNVSPFKDLFFCHKIKLLHKCPSIRIVITEGRRSLWTDILKRISNMGGHWPNYVGQAISSLLVVSSLPIHWFELFLQVGHPLLIIFFW